MARCACPGCPDEAVYKEPVSERVREHVPDDSLSVCKRHVDATKDGIEKL